MCLMLLPKIPSNSFVLSFCTPLQTFRSSTTLDIEREDSEEEEEEEEVALPAFVEA